MLTVGEDLCQEGFTCEGYLETGLSVAKSLFFLPSSGGFGKRRALVRGSAQHYAGFEDYRTRVLQMFVFRMRKITVSYETLLAVGR